ncbi:MAG: exodeoxyribonuclease III, partial [Planctomycetota bacterium]
MSDIICASWNVNGIRSVERKGRLPWEMLPEAGIIGIQETKAKPGQLTEAIVTPPGWYGHWSSAERAGYSGVALFTREQPDEVIDGLGVAEFDAEGRVNAVRFGDVVVVNAYFPNSQEAGKRLDYKLAFCAAMEDFLTSWQERGCHTVLVGDYNIAHQPIDLARPKDNEKNPGYLPEERSWMGRYLGLGYHDVFREEHPDLPGAYTWWT